ncbi:MAG TPA: folylpolyglutamate synthase/dihydrofolate synthase family protein [Pedobacter sp.]|nr:folylpolyglutamate synthase/dihydrofolate synthase family protein [Pedobacter sp.]
MNYPQTLDFLYSKLPMFTRVGAIALKKDLHNTLVLCAALANPQHKFKSIHVAGTNGKGSTSHMLAAILQKAGYKTGLYTSPHLKDFRERIRINGKMIPKSNVINFVKTQKRLIQEVEPSFFEVTVAMAFDYFAKEKVDFAVIEVGLGGRLDSTNVITPELAVITNISLDHTNILGNTLTEIAKEKAGIIKKGVPVVIGEQHEETEGVFLDKAKFENAPIYFADKLLKLKESKVQNSKLVVTVQKQDNSIYPELKLDLTGKYQQKNILTVIESINQLQDLGYKISDDAIYSGLRNVKKITGLQGRWQTLSKNPLVICDTGHNIAGITEVLKNINATPHQKLHFVIGMVKDKDISNILMILPRNAHYYFCAPGLERALSAEELAMQASAFGLKGSVYSTVKEAAAKAKISASKNDLIFIGGSTFVVAEII